MNDSSLGRVICGLQLRNVHNRAAHARRSDEASIAEILNLLPAAIDALEFLAAPDPASGTGAEEGAVEVGGDDFAVVLDLAVDGWTLGPRHARVGDEDVQTGVEVGNDLVDDGVDFGLVGDVELVGFACCLGISIVCSFLSLSLSFPSW